MPLTLVLGPANSARAGELLGAWRGAAARGGAVLVVPTARDAEHYLQELAAEGTALGSVLTFAGLIELIGERVGVRARRLSPVARARLVRRVARRARLGSSAESPGFARAAGGLIAELGRELVTPQRFAAALRAWARADPRREPFTRELAALPLAYARELERLGVQDGELRARRVLDALRARPGGWGGEDVFWYGFDDLTALERDAIETLAREAEVSVSLTWEPGREAMGARAEVVESLRPLAERVRELPARREHYAPDSRAALHHLERNLFVPGAGQVDPGAAVRVLEAGSERGEAELVAAEVLEALGEGVPAESIALVARRPEAVAAVFTRVFGEYGIPLRVDRERLVASTALGRGLRALARCAWAGAAGAADLLVYLRTPGVLRTPEPADRVEAELRREGRDDLARARELSGLNLVEIDVLARTAAPAAELLRQGRRLLAAAASGGAPRRQGGDREGGGAPRLRGGERDDAAALRALAEALAELESIGEAAGQQELLELLEELVLTPEDGAAAEGGAVRLSDPFAVRARRCARLIVVDLQEGSFPAPGRGETFLPDELRFELAQASGLALRRGEDALPRERHLLYACLSRATERVVLSYRSSDEEGNLALASPFLADVAALFTPDLLAGRRRRLLADVVWDPAAAPTPRERARALAAQVNGRPAEGVVARRLGPLALERVRHTQVVSAGALEGYARCAVAWLVEKQLEPRRMEPDPEPLSRGSYVHDVLEAVLRRLAEPLVEGSLPRALEILEEVLVEAGDPPAPGQPKAVAAAARIAVRADLRRLLEHEAACGPGWLPHELELGFGYADGPPALRLGEGADAVLVRGWIDRVDVEPGARRAVVRDYKSGAAKPEHQGSRWEQDGQLQVALYMLAVRRLLGLEPVAGFYQPLAGRTLRPRGLYRRDVELGNGLYPADGRDAGELEGVLAASEARAVEIAAALRAGEVTPCPATCSRNGCRHPAICRVG